MVCRVSVVLRFPPRWRILTVFSSPLLIHLLVYSLLRLIRSSSGIGCLTTFFSFRRFSFYRAVLQFSSKNSSRDLPNCPFSLLVLFSPLVTLDLCSFSTCYPLVLLMYFCWLNVLLFPFFFFLPRPSAGICDFYLLSCLFLLISFAFPAVLGRLDQLLLFFLYLILLGSL